MTRHTPRPVAKTRHGTGQTDPHPWQPWPGNAVLCRCGRRASHPVHASTITDPTDGSAPTADTKDTDRSDGYCQFCAWTGSHDDGCPTPPECPVCYVPDVPGHRQTALHDKRQGEAWDAEEYEIGRDR